MLSRTPPKFYPANLSRHFAADPFDQRMHDSGPQRDHTPLGLILEAYGWLLENGTYECYPVIRSFRECLMRECPDSVSEFEGLLTVQSRQTFDRVYPPEEGEIRA